MRKTVHTYLRNFNKRHQRFAVATSMMRSRIYWGLKYRELAELHGVCISTAWRWVHAAAEYSQRQTDIQVRSNKEENRTRITRVKRAVAPKVRRSCPQHRKIRSYVGNGCARTDDSLMGEPVKEHTTKINHGLLVSYTWKSEKRGGSEPWFDKALKEIRQNLDVR